MTKKHADLNRLAGRINSNLPTNKTLVVYENRNKYTVKTIGNKTVIDGYDYRDTDLIMRGMLELANLKKSK